MDSLSKNKSIFTASILKLDFYGEIATLYRSLTTFKLTAEDCRSLSFSFDISRSRCKYHRYQCQLQSVNTNNNTITNISINDSLGINTLVNDNTNTSTNIVSDNNSIISFDSTSLNISNNTETRNHLYNVNAFNLEGGQTSGEII